MEPLHMIELQFDTISLLRFMKQQGFPKKDLESQVNYGIHAWLKAAFGETSPQPWRLLMDRNRPPRILGYSSDDATGLRQRITEFADPSVLQVCSEPQFMIASRPMPIWNKGRRLRFHVLLCPVGRKSRSGIEKDLFLIHADTAKENIDLSRESIYCNWTKNKFENYSTPTENIQMTSFRLTKQIRRNKPPGKKRGFRQIVRPEALLEGDLMIEEPDRFTLLLKKGLGRHRAFGFGMILLRPIS